MVVNNKLNQWLIGLQSTWRWRVSNNEMYLI